MKKTAKLMISFDQTNTCDWFLINLIMRHPMRQYMLYSVNEILNRNKHTKKKIRKKRKK
jgi:hypothetical protein